MLFHVASGKPPLQASAEMCSGISPIALVGFTPHKLLTYSLICCIPSRKSLRVCDVNPPTCLVSLGFCVTMGPAPRFSASSLDLFFDIASRSFPGRHTGRQSTCVDCLRSLRRREYHSRSAAEFSYGRAPRAHTPRRAIGREEGGLKLNQGRHARTLATFSEGKTLLVTCVK